MLRSGNQREKPQTNNQLSSFTPWPLLKLVTPSFLLATASAIKRKSRGYWRFSLDKNLEMEKFTEGKGYEEFKESAASHGEDGIKREVGAGELFFKRHCKTKSCLFAYWTSHLNPERRRAQLELVFTFRKSYTTGCFPSSQENDGKCF